MPRQLRGKGHNLSCKGSHRSWKLDKCGQWRVRSQAQEVKAAGLLNILAGDIFHRNGECAGRGGFG